MRVGVVVSGIRSPRLRSIFGLSNLQPDHRYFALRKNHKLQFQNGLPIGSAQAIRARGTRTMRERKELKFLFKTQNVYTKFGP